MYKYFRVQNFRGIKDLELKDLAQINLIGGKNNIGKTSLLEAIFVMGNPYNPELYFRVNLIRGKGRIHLDDSNRGTPLDSLFYQFDANSEIVFHAITHTNEKYQFTISLRFDTDHIESENINQDEIMQEASSTRDANIILPIKITDISGEERVARVSSDGGQVKFTSPKVQQRPPLYFFASIVRENSEVIAERYSNIVNAGQENFILEILQRIEPRIQSIQLLYQNGEPVLAADIGMDKKLPINYMGDGLNRVLAFALAIGNAQDGVVLIDEIDSGLHYSILPMIWTEIAHVAQQFNVQVIATTHSMEMIRAAHEAFSATGDVDFCYYRLDPNPENGTPIAVRYTQSTMSAAVEMGYEVRG